MAHKYTALINNLYKSRILIQIKLDIIYLQKDTRWSLWNKITFFMEIKKLEGSNGGSPTLDKEQNIKNA
jgi:hypothetical protein